ncbi:GNAT family N-acetyltransferase [Naasia lichenicola]|uniref:GNAT family N-acetyltransferase n=1 Tax=Naasia lichenicola TaxID=2565933 RepID=A0A4S4FH25_9MICO|nr:GNAT family N-acetyltransferase [Naasia lichenicola]THG29563.1 GNAT family N-acetyltransferase [Naasia lichenicola]
MTEAPTLRTERLILRPWKDDDLAGFAELNADPEVMRHFPSLLSTAESDAFAARIRARLAEDGWGLWAVEIPGDGPASGFVGFTGLARPRFHAHFTPAVEVGWRFAQRAWGRGYATEAAQQIVDFAFDELSIDELVSLTAVGNLRSQAVMRRLGMTYDPADDFAHPMIPADSPSSAHRLFRLRPEQRIPRPSPPSRADSVGS